MYDTNSIYFENEPNSNQEIWNYESLKLKKKNFSINNFNKCRHYNKINQTNITRVSLDFRIIPYSKFYTENKKSITNKLKFELGDYYMLF